MAVRLAGRDDLLAVLSVHARRDDPAAPTPVSSSREMAAWDRMTASPDLTVYLAEFGGVAVGTASMMVMPNVTYGCQPTAFIEAVVVAADHRRRGIATSMLRRALEDARRDGCNKVQLLSHKRHVSDGAHRLYTSVGFEAEAEGFRLYLGEVPAAVAAARDARAR